jgi:hypothetical protein
MSDNACPRCMLSASFRPLEPLRASRYEPLSTGLGTDHETRDLTLYNTGNDHDEDSDKEPEPPVKVVDKTPARTDKRNSPREAPSAAPANTEGGRGGRRGGFTGNEQGSSASFKVPHR